MDNFFENFSFHILWALPVAVALLVLFNIVSWIAGVEHLYLAKDLSKYVVDRANRINN
jgi:hypothetical protein